VHADNINAFFHAIETQYGNVGSYLRTGLGLTDDAIALLQARLLQ